MPIYPLLAIVAVAATLLAELRFVRTGILRDPAYWITIVICMGFMIAVDGWLTKRSAPIVLYSARDTSGIRPIWDILIEEYAYGFALLTIVMMTWDVAGRRQRRRAGAPRIHAEVTP
jgi:lycopene cyclase domain-containing protein